MGATILYGVSPPLRTRVDDAYSAAKDKVMSVVRPQFVPVHAISIAGSSGAGDHPAGAALDGFKNTYWSTAPGDDDPVLRVGFEGATTLVRMIVHDGIAADFQKQSRAKALHLVYDTGASDDVELKDAADPQTVALHHAKGVHVVEVHVVSAYHALASKSIAVTEIEFFAKE